MEKKALTRAILITFEGPEGSGKTTHARRLCRYLKEQGFSLLHLREPGGTVIGEQIRRILLDARNKRMNTFCEMLLYQAARAQIVYERLLPALKDKRIVVLDRFLDATICYQGYGQGVPLDLIKRIGKLATGGIQPDLTILLDIDAEQGLRRCKSRDRMERKSLEFHRRVRRGYLKLAYGHPHRIKIVRAVDDITQTQEVIRKLVNKAINKYVI